MVVGRIEPIEDVSRAACSTAAAAGTQSRSAGVHASQLEGSAGLAAARFREQGMLRIDAVLPLDMCCSMRALLDSNLERAQAALRGEMIDGGQPKKRWDTFLPLDPPTLGATRAAIAVLRPLLNELFRPDAALCELAALITDGGAARQPLHFDTPDDISHPRTPLLATCFVALQDIDNDMGPTCMLPRTHNAAAHQQLPNANEAILGDLLGPVATVGTLEQHPVVRCAIPAGTVMLMDSRLLHCGGANTSAPSRRRRLLYFTLHDGGGQLPQGASYSMFPNYRNKLMLGEVDTWDLVMEREHVQPEDGLTTTPRREGGGGLNFTAGPQDSPSTQFRPRCFSSSDSDSEGWS